MNTGNMVYISEIIRCPNRGDPPYGNARVSGYTPGSTIYYTCNKGYRLIGYAWQKCLYSGEWSRDEPVCKSVIQCPKLDDPMYGEVNVSDNCPGSGAHYKCDYGYKLVGDEYRECQNNGYWSGKRPVCKST